MCASACVCRCVFEYIEVCRLQATEVELFKPVQSGLGAQSRSAHTCYTPPPSSPSLHIGNLSICFLFSLYLRGSLCCSCCSFHLSHRLFPLQYLSNYAALHFPPSQSLFFFLGYASVFHSSLLTVEFISFHTGHFPNTACTLL